MANTITFLRVIIALIVLLIMQINPLTNLIAIFFIVISMLLDALDGFIARQLNITTLSGSIYDILADRIIENIFFIFFASMSLLNAWIAIIILIRGLTIDSIRTIFISTGKSAFGKNTLHTKKWAKTLTCSKLSRGLYNTFKMITFICFAALLVPQGYIFKFVSLNNIHLIASISVWLTVMLALLRAIPVVIEGWLYSKTTNQ